MIKPFQIATLKFANNLIQGPLAGISCAPFRLMVWNMSKPAYTCTEMISINTLVQNAYQATKRYWYKDKTEGRVCFQLSGNEPKILAEAVKRATDYGADLIDLNCGCPIKKIRNKGAGSKLLSTPSHLYTLIRAMKQNTSLPIGIKIRVQGNSNEKFNVSIAQAIAEAEADFVVVHGRHWQENYEVRCHYEEIKFFVETLSIPVIGNGDISCYASLKSMLETGCAAAMISRAGVGQPWLISKLKSEAAGNPYDPPSNQQIGQLCVQHLKHLIDFLQDEKKAILEMRSIAKYYARALANQHAFCKKINETDNLKDFIGICQNFLK